MEDATMECPFCGAGEIRYQKLMSMTGYQCARCGQRWMEMGRPRFEVEREQAEAERFAAAMTYAAQGLVTWPLFFVGYFLACFHRPFTTLGEMPLAVGGTLLAVVLGTGLVLGWTLLSMLDFTGRWMPGWKPAHIVGPLLGAASVGGFFGILLLGLSSETWPGLLQMRDPLFCSALGAGLAMLAAPIIIVRSAARLRRRGFRSEPRSERDDRWDS